jgi:carboxylesterase type B
VNYRLGALGLLNLNTGEAGGNQALKDQLAALQWVHANIALFGGDSERVTLAGSGDGAACAHMHQLSPHGRGLYSGIIAQSGTAISGYIEVLNRNVVADESKRFLEKQECTDESAFECLQGKELAELMAPIVPEDETLTEIENELNGNGPYVFTPSVDRLSPNPFLPTHPYRTLMSGGQKDLPILTGLSDIEGLQTVRSLAAQMEDISGNWSFFGPSVVLFTRFSDIREVDQDVANTTRQYYLGDNEAITEEDEGIVDMFTDAVWRAPMVKAMKLQSRRQNAPVYMYEVTHEASGADEIPDGRAVNDPTTKFIFGPGTKPGSRSDIVTEEDQATSDAMVKMWTNFVKFYDPTPFEDPTLPDWLPYDDVHQKYLEIGPQPEMKENTRRTAMYFWQKNYLGDLDNYFSGSVGFQQGGNLHHGIAPFPGGFPPGGSGGHHPGGSRPEGKPGGSFPRPSGFVQGRPYPGPQFRATPFKPAPYQGNVAPPFNQLYEPQFYHYQ